ncbi:sugar ABC transporter substrate-binding protein [Microbacterium sp. NIBRBAC000506063]|nr:sugar ABC transporter substrate-binding protein [Microbacterium sp. NIBRBAC000506063]
MHSCPTSSSRSTPASSRSPRTRAWRASTAAAPSTPTLCAGRRGRGARSRPDPGGANVVVLNGPAGNFHSTARRDAWQKEFFDVRSDVTIVAEDIANWNKDEALTLMEDWSLANSDIDAIISMNDNMATGALEAVKGKSGFDGILAFGVDGTPEAALLIADGGMTATSLQNARELAQLNLKAVHDLLTGAQSEVHVDVGNPLITRDNAQEYIDLYKEAGLIDQ